MTTLLTKPAQSSTGSVGVEGRTTKRRDPRPRSCDAHLHRSGRIRLDDEPVGGPRVRCVEGHSGTALPRSGAVGIRALTFVVELHSPPEDQTVELGHPRRGPTRSPPPPRSWHPTPGSMALPQGPEPASHIGRPTAVPAGDATT